jgi:arylsulfatase
MDGDSIEINGTPLIFSSDPIQSTNLVDETYLSEHADQRDFLAAKLEQMKNQWFVQAGIYNGMPLDDRSSAEVLGGERPQLRPPAFAPDAPNTATFSYTYYPGGSEIPEAVAPNIRGRSYAIEAIVDFSSSVEGDVKGVLLAHGGRFGGHSFYIHAGKLCYVYNWLGQQQQKISCPLPDILAGEVTLKVEFAKKPDKPEPAEDFGGSTRGEVKLYIGADVQNATKENTFDEYAEEFLTQPGKFALSGEGFNIGRDAGQPVSTDYEHEIPYEFEGAKLTKVIVTITNDAGAIDYEKELRGMLMRD